MYFFDLRWYISLLLGPRRSSTESCGCPYGGISLPKFHKNQYILMGQNKKTKLQAKKIPDKTTSRRICKYSFSLHILNPPKLRNNIRKYRKGPTKKSRSTAFYHSLNMYGISLKQFKCIMTTLAVKCVLLFGFWQLAWEACS